MYAWEVRGEAADVLFDTCRTQREAEMRKATYLQRWANQYGPDDTVGLKVVRVTLSMPLED